MPKPPTGYRHRWLPWQEEFMRQHYPHYTTQVLAAVLQLDIKRIHAKANDMGLKKTPQVIAEVASHRTQQLGHGSQRFRFQPGQVPWNKGIKGSTGTHEATRATQFKPGQKPHTTMPLGSLRIVDGQLQRKFSDAPGGPHMRWRPVARLVWEAAHGPVPPGHIVAFKPGRATTDEAAITLDAIELITKAENLHRNKYPPELQRIAQLRGALTRAINRRLKEQAAP